MQSVLDSPVAADQLQQLCQRGTICWHSARWQYSASPVTTAPFSGSSTSRCGALSSSAACSSTGVPIRDRVNLIVDTLSQALQCVLTHRFKKPIARLCSVIFALHE